MIYNIHYNYEKYLLYKLRKVLKTFLYRRSSNLFGIKENILLLIHDTILLYIILYYKGKSIGIRVIGDLPGGG
jgi:hypothetical protein